MAARATLFDEALNLPTDERVELAVKLLDSVGQQAHDVHHAAWDAEIRKRVGRMLDGDANVSSWADARARILDRLAHRAR